MKPLLHLVGILFPHINDDARSKPHQICFSICLFTQTRGKFHPKDTFLYTAVLFIHVIRT